MNYLIVCQSNGKHYLMLAEDNAIQAYTSKEEVMKAFKGFTDAWTRSYESSMSACIGMMNMMPIAIEAPEDITLLTPYILSQQIYKISGGAIGRGYNGILVSSDILKYKQFEIWKESMTLAGIYK